MSSPSRPQTPVDSAGGDPTGALGQTGTPAGPLAGVRVLDFAWSVAGPTVTKILAALGAEVLKVEWPARPDQMRFALYQPDERHFGLDNGVFFADNNVGKRSLSIDARSEQGRELLCRLIAKCDVVTESFSAGVFERWGFSYERLRELRPDVIYLSVSGFGHTGRYRDRDCWGPTAQAFNGLTFVSGLPGREPAGWGWSYMDLAAGFSATVALLAALVHRKLSGEGQQIDVSQIETGIALSGPLVLDYTVNGRPARDPFFPPGNRSAGPDSPRTGARGEVGAPYGAYPTLGDDDNDFCVITVLDDGQWRALRRAMGEPEWAADPGLDHAEQRISAQELLDARLAEWTIGYRKYELVEFLQTHGVPAGAVQSAEDRMDHDPQLTLRGAFPTLKHPLLGPHRFQGPPFRLTETPLRSEARWPLMGADNDYVLRELLDLDPEEISRLSDAGVLWPAGMDTDPEYPRALW